MKEDFTGRKMWFCIVPPLCEAFWARLNNSSNCSSVSTASSSSYLPLFFPNLKKNYYFVYSFASKCHQTIYFNNKTFKRVVKVTLIQHSVENDGLHDK